MIEDALIFSSFFLVKSNEFLSCVLAEEINEFFLFLSIKIPTDDKSHSNERFLVVNVKLVRRKKQFSVRRRSQHSSWQLEYFANDNRCNKTEKALRPSKKKLKNRREKKKKRKKAKCKSMSLLRMSFEANRYFFLRWIV